MRIRDVRTYALTAPLEQPFYFAAPGLVQQRSTTVVEVLTDEGVVGFGEALCHGHQPPELAAEAVRSCLAEMVIGRDPLAHCVLFEEMVSRARDFGPKGAFIGAISAIDIALWDIAGQALGQPVHQLLGGPFATASSPTRPGSTAWRDGPIPRRWSTRLGATWKRASRR